MAKRNTVPPHIRKILSKQSRDLTRRSSKQAMEELDHARSELRTAAIVQKQRAYRQTSSAILNALMGMTSAVARSWGISSPIYLKAQTYGDNLAAATDFKSVRIRYPMKGINIANDESASERFNVSQLKIIGNDIRALVYHEVGHIRFTTPLPDLIVLAGSDLDLPNHPDSRQIHRAWNLLEDQRMEAAVVNESPVIAKYFTTLVLRWMLDQRKTHASPVESQWLLIAGRRYLPVEVRRDMRNKFRNTYGADAVREASEIIRRYMSATEATVMFGAVMDMRDLLKKLSIAPERMDEHDQPRSGRNGNLSKDRNMDEERERMSDSATTDDEPVEDEQQQNDESVRPDDDNHAPSEDAASGSDEPSTDIDGGDPAPSDGEGDDSVVTTPQESSVEDSDLPTDITDRDRRGELENDESIDSRDGDGLSAGSGKRSDEPEPPSLEELIKESQEHIDEDEVLQDLVRSANENILNADEALPKDTVWTHQQDDAAATAVSMAIDIASALRVYTADTEPLWQNRTNRGYIDPFAYRTRSSGSTDYRRMLDDEGNTGTDVSVTVMLDTSSSMEGTESALGVVAYACKRACEIIDVPCTVMTFDSDGHLLWGKDDEAQQVSLNTDGGTSPTNNFEALDSFRFDKSTHLVLMMTDGAFGFRGCNYYRSEGRYFVGIAYGRAASAESLLRYEFDAAKQITDLNDIPEILRDFLASFLR